MPSQNLLECLFSVSYMNHRETEDIEGSISAACKDRDDFESAMYLRRVENDNLLRLPKGTTEKEYRKLLREKSRVQYK